MSPLRSLLAPLLVLASAAASSCIFLVDEAIEGAGAGGSGTGAAGTGGEGAGSPTATSAGGAGGGSCAATVTGVGEAHPVIGLGASSELVLSVVPPLEGSSSAAFVRLFNGTIRRFSIVPGNGAPIQAWLDAAGLYPGARLAPAPDDEVLVTHDGRVFRLAGGSGELAPEDDLKLPDSITGPRDEAVEVGDKVYVRLGERLFRVGESSLITTPPLDRLTANAFGAHWIASMNVVYSCSDANCARASESHFFESTGPFPVFTVRSSGVQTIYLRTSDTVDPAFVGPVGSDLLSVDDQSPMAGAVSAAFVGDHLVVVTESGDVHACCVDGVPSCGPVSELRSADLVAASPAGDRAVLALDGALQLITVTEP